MSNDYDAGGDLTEEDLVEVLRSETGWHSGKKVTGKCLASKYGVSEQYMNNVLSRRRGIGEKLSSAMGFDMVITFKRKTDEQ